MKNLKVFLAALIICMVYACQNKTATTDTEVKADSAKSTVAPEDTSKKPTPVANTSDAATARSENFEIAIPAGWAAKQNNISGRTMLFLTAPAKGGYQTNINILKDAMKGESLDDYIKVSMAKMQGMNVTMGKTSDFEVGGIKGKAIKYLYTTQGRMIAVKSYIFPKDDVAYIVTATTLPQYGKEFEPVFDSAVSTLKIK